MSLGLFVFSMDTDRLVLRVVCMFTSQISLLPAAYTGWWQGHEGGPESEPTRYTSACQRESNPRPLNCKSDTQLVTPPHHIYQNYKKLSWWRSTVVERRSLTGELSLSCARPAADGWPLMWVNHPQQVSQLGKTQPFILSGSINE